MNVFASDPSPSLSAEALCDRHVVKMVLETAQILSTVCHELGMDYEVLYRPTHRNHPCTRAAIDSREYLGWVAQHGAALSAEYKRRFHKRHRSEDVIFTCAGLLDGTDLWQHGVVPDSFPLAMPDEFKSADPHKSYRDYLTAKYAEWIELGKRAPRWTNQVPPKWLMRKFHFDLSRDPKDNRVVYTMTRPRA